MHVARMYPCVDRLLSDQKRRTDARSAEARLSRIRHDHMSLCPGAGPEIGIVISPRMQGGENLLEIHDGIESHKSAALAYGKVGCRPRSAAF